MRPPRGCSERRLKKRQTGPIVWEDKDLGGRHFKTKVVSLQEGGHRGESRSPRTYQALFKKKNKPVSTWGGRVLFKTKQTT